MGLTEVHELYIGYRYVDTFDRYLKEVNSYEASQLLSMKLLSNVRKMMKVVRKMGNDAIASRLLLNNHMGNKCPAKEVKTVYEGVLKIH